MDRPVCHVRNLRESALSGHVSEIDAIATGGRYLAPDASGYYDASLAHDLCVTCVNCGSIIEESPGAGELSCPVCGESTFHVFQTFRLVMIKNGFSARWQVQGLMVAIDVPASARDSMTGIRYTVDGSDPTLASPLYTKPIPYRKTYAPLRAAVYYNDARSQIVEWDYGRTKKKHKRIPKKAKDETGRPTFPPAPIPPPRTPYPKPTKTPRRGNRKSGCGKLVVFAMGICGMVLVWNEKNVAGWTLIVLAILTSVCMFHYGK